ncbi:hypothetical protein [Iamia sp.]|uniref:hypothetical protein n=1 Tax=Iamia sp. TaxID=2722710 RepID=UPI002BF9C1C1|nr:hypothetical protein [Iamia sp.]HXH57390.1 hypothetical protein [Iamia sp.]
MTALLSKTDNVEAAGDKPGTVETEVKDTEEPGTDEAEVTDLPSDTDEAEFGLTDLFTGAVRAETEETGGLPPISAAELEAQALAAGPVDVPDDDAVSYWEVAGRDDLGLLPDWYMPTAGAGSRRLHGWRRRLAWSLVATFLSINAAGLCSTYGRIEGLGL